VTLVTTTTSRKDVVTSAASTGLRGVSATVWCVAAVDGRASTAKCFAGVGTVDAGSGDTSVAHTQSQTNHNASKTTQKLISRRDTQT